jgi:hypothetical protein
MTSIRQVREPHRVCAHAHTAAYSPQPTLPALSRGASNHGIPGQQSPIAPDTRNMETPGLTGHFDRKKSHQRAPSLMNPRFRLQAHRKPPRRAAFLVNYVERAT